MSRPVDRFWIKVARSIGRTVHEAKQTMSHAEFIQWIAEYGLSPWGEDRADLRAGIVASTVANCNAPRKGKPFEPRDFMPHFDGKRPGSEPMTADQMLGVKARMKAYAKARQAVAVG